MSLLDALIVVLAVLLLLATIGDVGLGLGWHTAGVILLAVIVVSLIQHAMRRR